MGRYASICSYKYNNTIHSSTNETPINAHKDSNAVKVAINLNLKSSYKRKYPNISLGDKVKIFSKGKGNYTSRKETKSRWSEDKYEVDKIDYDINLNKYYTVKGLSKRFSRNELLLINE